MPMLTASSRVRSIRAHACLVDHQGTVCMGGGQWVGLQLGHATACQCLLTLPRSLRERFHVQPGSHISGAVIDGGTLQISNQPPIANDVGTLAGTWTAR